MKPVNENPTDSTRTALYSALFAALTAAGALIRIPVPPVPFTLQTFIVCLAAGIGGRKTGVISQLLYLTLGLSGLPIFSGGGGLSYIFQPQFGYLLGMPPAAFIIGTILEKDLFSLNRPGLSRTGRLARTSVAYAAGTFVIYLSGISYLWYYTAFIVGKEVDITYILWAGFIIFIPAAVLKIIAAAYITERLRILNVINRY